MRNIHSLFVIFLATLATTLHAEERGPIETGKARVTTSGASPALTLETGEDLPVKTITLTQVTKATISLKGTYKAPDSTLVIEKRRIPVQADGTFSTDITLTGIETSTILTSVGALGEIEKVKIEILCPSYPKLVRTTTELQAAPDQGRSIQWTVGAGISTLEYRQTRQPTLVEKVLTLKASARRDLSRHWDAGVSGYVNAATLSSSIPGVSLKFYGLNARIGYRFQNIKPPWFVGLMTGIYYTAALAPPIGWGYAGVGGPQLFPVVARKLDESHILSAYFKLSPVSDRFTFLDLTSREIAGGIAHTWTRGTKWPIGVALDYSNLRVNLPPLVANLQSLSLSATTQW